MTHKLIIPMLTVAIILLTSVVSISDELDDEHNLSTNYVTPHVDWAKPYAKGKIRGLFFVKGRGGDHGSFTSMGTTPREIIELAQRFDIEPTAVFMQANILHRGKAGEERLMRLLNQKFDVYVFGNASLKALPVEAQYRIVKQASEGAGLVCVGPKPKDVMDDSRILPLPDFLIRGTPLKALSRGAKGQSDAELASRIVKSYRLGKGRGVHISYPGGAHALMPRMTFSFRALTEYEYWMPLIGRAVLWAAGRESDVSLVDILEENLQVDRSKLPLKGTAVTVVSKLDKEEELTFNLRIRRTDGWAQTLPEVKLRVKPKEIAQVDATIPTLRSDQYFLEVIVKSSRGIETFGAGSLQVVSDRGVDGISLDSEFVERGNTISGKATLRGTDFADNYHLRVRLRDSYQRVLAQKDFPIPKKLNPIPFNFEIGDWATIFMRVEAVLMDGDEEVELKEAAFTVPKRRRGRFNFIMWDRPSDVLGYYALRKLREVGMSVILVGGAPGPALEACDFSQIPYTTRILDNYDEKGIMKPVCWNDEPAVDDYVNGIVNNNIPSRQHGVFLYSLGDETTTKGCCLHPACIKAYQNYLKDSYGTIEALNASWESNYKSFDEVKVLKEGDNFEKTALQQKLYARWYDRQAFARYNFAKFCKRFVKAYKKLDPLAITGFEGAGRFGEDYDTIVRTNGFWSPYPSIGDEIIRSIAPRNFIRSNWMGYNKTADPLVTKAWRMVTMGCDSVWWWRWDGIGRFHGYLAPDLDLWPATKELAKEMKVIRDGLGDLLIHSEMLHDGIAILYSMPSAFANQLDNTKDFCDIRAAHQAFVSVTEDLGLQFRYITRRQLKEGVLDGKSPYKVLVLPFTQAIGAEEAKAIRRFVENGGTLLADLRPGIYDDHCKPLKTGAIDDLLGIKRKGRGEPKTLDIAIDCELDGRKLLLNMKQTQSDAHVLPADAKSLVQQDGVPLLLTHHAGKGRTILLNFHIASYESERTSPDSDDTRQFIRSLYALAGVAPRFEEYGADGKPLRGSETVFWQTGEQLVFSLRKVVGEDEQARIVLPQARHIYDLRQRRYLGNVKEIKTNLRLGRANFFALLNYEVRGVNLGVSMATPGRGDQVTVEVSINRSRAGKGRHAIYVEGFDPKGKQVSWLRRVVLLSEDTHGEFKVPIAYNDAAGVWKIVTTDLYSQRSAEIEYRLVK